MLGVEGLDPFLGIVNFIRLVSLLFELKFKHTLHIDRLGACKFVRERRRDGSRRMPW